MASRLLSKKFADSKRNRGGDDVGEDAEVEGGGGGCLLDDVLLVLLFEVGGGVLTMRRTT